MIDALSAAAGRPVSRETLAALKHFEEMLREENARQNLVSASTLAQVWERHILDSVQLVRFEPRRGVRWLDIGSGAGLPGLVIAALIEGAITLVEPRRLRAEFLVRAAAELGLAHRVTVEQAKVQRITGRFDVITARAVAPLARLLELSHHLSTGKTRWVLPKGRSVETELADARRAWQAVFHVEPSVTSADSRIVLVSGVKPK